MLIHVSCSPYYKICGCSNFKVYKIAVDFYIFTGDEREEKVA